MNIQDLCKQFALDDIDEKTLLLSLIDISKKSHKDIVATQEIKKLIPWGQAPDWANYVATDFPFSEWDWYEAKPMSADHVVFIKQEGTRHQENAFKSPDHYRDFGARLFKRPTTHVCNWQQCDEGIWHTACGHSYSLTSESPIYINQTAGKQFCCYCGQALIEPSR